MTVNRILRVVLWMAGALSSFSAMAIGIRLLAAKLNVFEMLAIRSGTGLVIALMVLAVRPQDRMQIRLAQIKIHLLRNVVHFVAQVWWALALTLLPFATVFALEFFAPAWTALFAVIILGEKLTKSRIGVIVLGFIGVLIILRPGVAAFDPAALLVLAAAVGYAATFIATKFLTRIESTLAIIFWMMLIQLPLCLIGSDPLFALRLDASDLPAVLALGLGGVASHYCLSNAFRAGDATLVVPLDFVRVPLIAMVGFLFFGEPLDGWIFVGVAVILCGILWNLRAEARRLHAAAIGS